MDGFFAAGVDDDLVVAAQVGDAVHDAAWPLLDAFDPWEAVALEVANGFGPGGVGADGVGLDAGDSLGDEVGGLVDFKSHLVGLVLDVEAAACDPGFDGRGGVLGEAPVSAEVRAVPVWFGVKSSTRTFPASTWALLLVRYAPSQMWA